MNLLKTVKGDITKITDVQAIVNAANQSLLGGGGVDGAIHRAAGPELLKECRTLHGCHTGEAKITKAYQLPCDYVIHTVGPVWTGGGNREEELLASCYYQSMQLAFEHGIRTIAFPSISTGVYRFPVELAAKVAVETVREFLQEHQDSFDLVEWVLFDSYTESVYEREVNKPYLSFYKSIVDQDRASVVICNLTHEIIYMNPAAVQNYAKRGGEKLIGRSLLNCHNQESREKIQKVIDWFAEDESHNIVYTYHNEKQNKDVYMVALREAGKLIGYYEKHEYRNAETMKLYDLWR